MVGVKWKEKRTENRISFNNIRKPCSRPDPKSVVLNIEAPPDKPSRAPSTAMGEGAALHPSHEAWAEAGEEKDCD